MSPYRSNPPAGPPPGPKKYYSEEEMEYILNKRLVENARRDEQVGMGRRLTAVEKAVEMFTGTLNDLHPVLKAIETMGVLTLNPEELAAFREVVRSKVLLDEEAAIKAKVELDASKEREKEQRKWTRLFAVVAVLEPIVVPIIDKLWSVHL